MELCKKNIIYAQHSTDLDDLVRKIILAFQSITPARYEFRHVNRDGHVEIP